MNSCLRWLFTLLLRGPPVAQEWLSRWTPRFLGACEGLAFQGHRPHEPTHPVPHYVGPRLSPGFRTEVPAAVYPGRGGRGRETGQTRADSAVDPNSPPRVPITAARCNKDGLNLGPLCGPEFTLWSGKTPCTTGQLAQWATPAEACWL